jgi:hypothetical protein
VSDQVLLYTLALEPSESHDQSSGGAGVVPKIPASESVEPGVGANHNWSGFVPRTACPGHCHSRPARALVRNGSGEQVVVVDARVSPLVEEHTRLAMAEGALTAQVPAGTLAAGEAAMVEIGGTVPAQPGRYTAHLGVRCDAGIALSTLVRTNVSASAVWGIGCMSLLLLGVLKLMTGEGDVRERTRETLRTRAEIHADWQRTPPPQSRRAEVAEIDYDLDEAVRTLTRPRGFSVVDRRLADSGELLAAGREVAAKLRDAMAKEPPGTEASRW